MRSSDIEIEATVHPDVAAGVKALLIDAVENSRTDRAPVLDPHITPDGALVAAWNAVAADVHATNRSKGFWDKERNEGEVLMLIVSELAEALENIRHGKTPDDKIPQFKGVEAELADALIRIMDYGHGFGYDVIGALVAKRAFNKTRPHMHGKKF